MPVADDAVRQEAAYYQSIEEAFVERRGDPLMLSNADWTLIRRWRLAGVPLRVVLRGIADAFDARAHSWARDRKVASLRYCESEVDQAFERWQRALAGGLDGSELGRAEQRLRQALREAEGRLSGRLSGLVAELLAAWSAETAPQGAALEAWLREREDLLLAELSRAAGAEALEALQAEVELDLLPYRERLPERILAQVRDESLRRRLLESAGLPRISLFEGC
jgi:hypothetical protein